MTCHQILHPLVAPRDAAIKVSQDDHDRMKHSLPLFNNNEVGVATWKDVKARWLKAALWQDYPAAN